MKQTLLVANLMLLAAFLAAAQKTPESMLGAAMHQAEVQGDLKGAIAAYQKVVATRGVSRKTAADALLRMGQCYEKLGDTESRKAYERVLREYADQKEAVVVARAHLERNGALERRGELVLRKVWTGDISGAVSPDGRRLSYVDWISPSTSDWGTLRLRDFTTGKDRPLTSHNVEYKGSASTSAISRDGTQVAYSWGTYTQCEIRVASLQLDGVPASRKLFESEDVEFISPMDWSPDGKWIAVRIQRKDHTGQVGLVAVQDGSLRVLKSVDWRGPTKVLFSPDGRDLAFDLPVSESSDQRDVLILAADGTREIAAVVHAGNNVVMGWLPDGRHLLFASDRSGSMGLWALAFSERRPQGTPQLIKANIGSAASLGVTTAGSLYLGVETGSRDIEVASIDLTTGKQVTAPVRPIQNFIGSNREPTWSRDGKYLAYVSARGPKDRSPIIGIRSVDTGDVRELPVKSSLAWLVGLSWSPDGHYFLGLGTDVKGRNGVFRVDAQTGAVVPVIVPTPERPSYEGFFWSPNEKRIYYHSQKGTIYERDLASGKEREVIRGHYGPISLSPDGRWIATAKWDASTKSQTVVLIPVEGGEPRELLRVSNPQWINNTSMPWTPDAKGLLVRKMLVAGGKMSELWLVPVDNAPPRKLNFDVNRVMPYAPGKIRLHPDGRQLAYVFGETSSEVWVLENFLPTLNAKNNAALTCSDHDSSGTGLLPSSPRG